MKNNEFIVNHIRSGSHLEFSARHKNFSYRRFLSATFGAQKNERFHKKLFL